MRNFYLFRKHALSVLEQVCQARNVDDAFYFFFVKGKECRQTGCQYRIYDPFQDATLRVSYVPSTSGHWVAGSPYGVGHGGIGSGASS